MNDLRAFLSTHAAQYFTANNLYNALKAQDCFSCGRFDAFLYLLERRRCCWQCPTNANDLLPKTQIPTLLNDPKTSTYVRRSAPKVPNKP